MSVRRSIGWSAAGQTAAFAIQFIASVIVARLLSPTEMGVFAVGLATLALFSSIEAFGLQSMVVREPELNERLVASATTINGLIALAIAAATALASTLAGGFFGKAGVTHVMALIALGPL
ncbi:MAG: oligosaccharide flippase family protein, partial [Phenylobacterium sp.]|uniref:oligosaccharide flippase family protein n=1 Tax=Phenylobacterium sp. TaxID=1871053 RepID=UPI0027376522